jgi:hypothetical protein
MLDKVRATLASDDLLDGVTIPKNSEFANIIQMCSGGLLQVVEQQHHDGQINSVVWILASNSQAILRPDESRSYLVDRINGEKLNMLKVIVETVWMARPRYAEERIGRPGTGFRMTNGLASEDVYSQFSSV